MKRASYRDAIEFIALNDCPGDDDSPEIIAGYASVVLVASIFAVDVDRVVRDVQRIREKEDL